MGNYRTRTNLDYGRTIGFKVNWIENYLIGFDKILYHKSK